MTKPSINLNDRLIFDPSQGQFLSHISMMITHKQNYTIPTMCVSFNKHQNKFQLDYNPFFLGQLSKEEIRSVLTHEYLHIMLGHLTTHRDENTSKKESALWNIAEDLAINSSLQNLPKGALIPGQGEFKGFNLNQTSEAYYYQINRKMQQDPEFKKKMEEIFQNLPEDKQGSGQSAQDMAPDVGNAKPGETAGMHGNRKDVEDFSNVVKAKVKKMVEKAIDQTTNNWGNISQTFQEQILKYITTTIDWKTVLHSFVKKSQRGERRTSIRRINKRTPYLFAGIKRRRVANIMVAIDQSGSVSSELLAKFYNELNKLSEYATFTVVPHDAGIDEDKIFVWKMGTKRNWDRVLSGGTDFNPPTEYVNKDSKFDGAIFLTDMEAPKPIDCKVKRIWVTDKKEKTFDTTEQMITIS